MLPGPIEDQQLVLDEHGFGDHGAGAAAPHKSGDCQQLQNKDGQIAHGTVVARSRHSRMRANLAMRHGQAST